MNETELVQAIQDLARQRSALYAEAGHGRPVDLDRLSAVEAAMDEAWVQLRHARAGREREGLPETSAIAHVRHMIETGLRS